MKHEGSCEPPAAGAGQPAYYASEYRNRLGLGNKLARAAWQWAWLLLGRTSPVPCFGWRRWLVRLFGGRIAPTARIYPTTRIWAPWNLVMEHRGCLGPEVECYNVAPVTVGVDATVSFRAFLCAASHDIRHPDRPLTVGPIRIERGGFVFADAFIGMNVTVHEGAVVAARAVVVRDVAAHEIVAGNPARVVSSRDLPETTAVPRTSQP